jgi:hypothetical protein
MTQLTRYAETLKAAVENGLDPITVDIGEHPGQGGKPKVQGNSHHSSVLFPFVISLLHIQVFFGEFPIDLL